MLILSVIDIIAVLVGLFFVVVLPGFYAKRMRDRSLTPFGLKLATFTSNPVNRRRMAAVVVFLAAFGVYIGNGSALPSGDTVPGKLIPISILKEHNMDMNEFVDSIYPGERYCMRDVGGRMLSSYPLGAVFTALPIYSVAHVLDPHIFGRRMSDFFDPGYGNERENVASFMEDLSSAIIAAFSVMLVWLIARFRLAVGPSFLITLGYALGTSIMSSASQALWTHGPSCLALTMFFYGVLKDNSGKGLIFVAGAAAAWAVFCRPTNILPLLVMAPWIVWNCRWKTLCLAGGGILVTAVTSAVNYSLYGHILGGYAGHRLMFESFNMEAVAGVLFSPSRGLFVFSPFLLLAVFLGAIVVRKRPSSYSLACVAGASVYVMIYGFWPDWGAGFSFGPRLLCDLVPFLIIPLIEGFDLVQRNRPLMAIFVTLLIFSCFVHVLGVYRGDNGWNGEIYRDQKTSCLLTWEDSQLIWTVFRQ